MKTPKLQGENFVVWHDLSHNTLAIRLEVDRVALTVHISAQEAEALTKFINEHVKKAA